MSVTHLPMSSAALTGAGPSLRDLTLLPLRVEIARFLVAFCFVWPFFNYSWIDPAYSMEINFLPVFLALIIVPEIALRDRYSILLAVPVFALAIVGASPQAAMRVGIGLIPLHFMFNLARHLRERNKELLYPGLAYRALQAFVVFCVFQTIDFYHFHIVPDAVTQVLITILPRYAGQAYDVLGIRGVQGWASEPSGAAVTCAAYALVAIGERPDRRSRVLALFAVLMVLNKSIYALVLGVILVVACLALLRRKLIALISVLPLAAAAYFYMARSGRLAEFHTNVQSSGVNPLANRDLARMIQIFTPLQQFPHIYQAPVLFGTIVMEPMGLLPLLAGYGSVLGVIWLAYILRRNLPLRQLPMRPLAIMAAFILLMMVAPDLIPSVVALAVFARPRLQSEARNQKPSFNASLESEG